MVDDISFGDVVCEGGLDREQVIFFVSCEPSPKTGGMFESVGESVFGYAIGFGRIDNDLSAQHFVTESFAQVLGELGAAAACSSRDRDDRHESTLLNRLNRTEHSWARVERRGLRQGERGSLGGVEGGRRCFGPISMREQGESWFEGK